ncbi:hypothetical protein [Streptomyces sp. NPDC026673]|uniref:hypothetical protein n=1 Tax=Streptomyces sp. NPDC026673 TaxID=3155724 RepID=UPI00340A2889
MSERYTARVIEVTGEGIRLQPAEGSVPPEQPTEVNLLGMAIALALGAAEYEHHPAPRDPRLQTLQALLAGEAVMPWRARGGEPGTVPYVECERSGSGAYVCALRRRPADDA